MKKVKISAGISGLTDPELSEKTAKVVACMTGNTDFQTPYPSLANITTAEENFNAALVKANGGSKSDTEYKNEMRAILEDALMLLASYVEDNSQNIASILLSSGFDMRSTPVRGAVAEAPTNVAVKDGLLSGEAIVSFKGARYATGYIVRYAEDLVSGTWKYTEFSSKTKIGLSGLVVGKDVWVQVKSVNSNGISEWSDPAVLRMVR